MDFSPRRLAARVARDRWLLAIAAASLCLNCFHLQWGLPNGNNSWAADANGPVTVLSVLHHSFSRFNSGWFYFKYPPGYPFELAAVFAPYLGFLLLTGGWRNPSSTYPYGFADAEHSLFVLALLGRLLSVAFATGTVLLAYGIGRRLFGLFAARLAACFVATLYPVVYYAHTTNLDAGYLFWLTLALYAAVVASESERRLPWAALGMAAAMAVSTKEQGFAFLLPLPLLVVALRARGAGLVRVIGGAPFWSMAGAAVLTLALANNAFFNPYGFVARIAYLIGRPLYPVDARLAPVEFALFKGSRELFYLGELGDCLDSGLGLPLAAAAAAGLALALARNRRAALWLLVPGLAYYYLSLRGLELIALRYTLPLLVAASVLAAGVLAALRANERAGVRLAANLAAGVLALLGLARAVELDWLLANDTRYGAERWLRENTPAGTRGEIYQKPAFVPRFRDGLAADFVAMDQRTAAGLLERGPQFVVLSGASRRSITQRWARDWRAGGMLTPVPEAVEMLAKIEDGSLGYRKAVEFTARPRLFRSRITSLAPRITIYVKG